MLKRLAAVLTAAFLMSGTAAQAQEPRGFCWFTTDSHCSVILLTEAGYARVLTRTTREYTTPYSPPGTTYEETLGPRDIVQWQLGLLKRIDPKFSAGATFQLRAGTPATFWYARGRYWLKPERSIELGIGQRGKAIPFRQGVSIFGDLSIDDYAIVRVTYDDLDWPSYLYDSYYTYTKRPSRARNLNAGVSLGAGPGGIAQALSAVGFATLVILYIRYGD